MCGFPIGLFIAMLIHPFFEEWQQRRAHKERLTKMRTHHATETLEFDRLERYINATGSFPHISQDEWGRSEEKRWLEPWDKHQAEMVPFVRSSKTRH
jgi:hypothetical protein